MAWRSSSNINKALRLIRNKGPVAKVFVFDTETTGLGKNDQIIQFSGVEYTISTSDMNIIAGQEYDMLICPDIEINPRASAVHGLTNDNLANYPSERVIGPKILNILGNQDILAGYNIGFDLRMVNQLKERIGAFNAFTGDIIDVLDLARDAILVDEVPNHKLQTITTYVCNTSKFQFHSAIDDVFATASVMEYCLRKGLDSELNLNPEEGLIKYNVQYAYYQENPRKRSEKRIKLMLYGEQKTVSWNPFGAIYWDCVKHCWNSRKDAKSKRIFKNADLAHVERQMLAKYHFSSMDALAKSWKSANSTR